MISLVVGNTRTSLYQVPQWMLTILDKELRYPTPLAIQSNEVGKPAWVPPKYDSWDGWIRLLKQPVTAPPSVPTGLLSVVQRLLTKFGLSFQVEDSREKPEDAFPDHPSEKLATRPYQANAVKEGLKVGRGVFDLPPRSGKTRISMEIVAKLGLPTLWIAPTDAIVQQTLGQFQRYFGEHYAHHQIGTKDLQDLKNVRVILCTAATAVRLSPEFYNTRNVLIIDEFHHSAAKSYADIMELCGHIYYRFGMTGTHFRSGQDALAMHALLSNVIYKITTAELRDLGYLVPTQVVYVPVDAPKLRCPSSDGRVAPWIKYGVQDHDYRNQIVAYVAAYLQRFGRKVLVLVGTKKQGRRLKQLISAQLPSLPDTEFESVEFLSTDRYRDVQKRVIKAFVETTEVKVLIGTSLLGEGVDLPSADALVYARGEKAEVTLTQSAYRVCTAISGKKDAIIVDFADRHSKKLLKHSKERLRIFHQDPLFRVEVLESVKWFGDWCRRNHLSALEVGKEDHRDVVEVTPRC